MAEGLQPEDALLFQTPIPLVDSRIAQPSPALGFHAGTDKNEALRLPIHPDTFALPAERGKIIKGTTIVLFERKSSKKPLPEA